MRKSAMLVGNTFPLALVRRKCTITPLSEEDGRKLLQGDIVSFWGHTNTLEAVRNFCGVSLKPREERPAISLGKSSLPKLYGKEYNQVLVVSPTYKKVGYRPEIGVEVSSDEISHWTFLLISFKG